MKIIEGKWGFFRPSFDLAFFIQRGNYFDNRYAISFAFIWGYFYIKLPFRTKLGSGCDMPRYGMDNHSGCLWLYWGGKYDESYEQMESERLFTFDYPFINWIFEEHLIMNNNMDWQLVKDVDLKNITYTIKLPYTYTLKNGTVQERTATCYQEKRQWHRKWFPFLKKTKVSIEVTFSDEVGERTGSWKGGCISCSYEMLKDESMEQCLKRMEKERKF